jgi:catechol 2,3-dioxygenase-like lactoylglutathione lyase family enzyme
MQVEVVGLHHVTLIVRDLDRAIDFYDRLFGFSPLPRAKLPLKGAWLARGPHQIHLVVSGEEIPDTNQHFAFSVADLDRSIQTLRDAGVQVTDPVYVGAKDPDWVSTMRQASLRDPDGNLLEINDVPWAGSA